MKNSNKNIYIILMSLLIVGTSIGGGILGLPLQTGLSGFVPSLLSFILICITMTGSGWILFLRFIKNKGTINNIAMLYNRELGTWAEYLNTIAYFVTFYGLLVAFLSGASTTVISITPGLDNIPEIHKIVTVIYFIFSTSLIIFGKKLLDRSNTLFSILLMISFAILIILTIDHVDPEKLKYENWAETTKALPILITAFGYHIVIPVIYTHCGNKKFSTRHFLYILLIGIIIVFIVNLVWSFVVMGILPLNSKNGISITSALAQGEPATIPISIYISSKSLILISILFTFFAITTSYIGVGAGLLNYVEGLISYHIKASKLLSISITFLVPFFIAIIYPGIFIKMLDLAGIGVIISCGLLPALLGLKKDNSVYIRFLSVFVITICIIVFIVECLSMM